MAQCLQSLYVAWRYYTGVNRSLRKQQPQQQFAKKEADFINLIVKAYKAAAVANCKTFVAKKAARLVAIGPINSPASRLFVEQVIKECIEKQIAKINKGAHKVLVEQGNIIKISKHKDPIVTRAVLTEKWTDWIDYWAVDFDFESKQEIVHIEK